MEIEAPQAGSLSCFVLPLSLENVAEDQELRHLGPVCIRDVDEIAQAWLVYPYCICINERWIHDESLVGLWICSADTLRSLRFSKSRQPKKLPMCKRKISALWSLQRLKCLAWFSWARTSFWVKTQNLLGALFRFSPLWQWFWSSSFRLLR